MQTSLTDFATTVKQLARIAPQADRFHDNKAFIAPLCRAYGRLNLPEFKAKLLEANREQLLHLSRADMVGLMDAEQVAASETCHLNATFHFVLID